MAKVDTSKQQALDINEAFSESSRQLRAPFIINELKAYGIDIRTIKEPKKSKYLDCTAARPSTRVFGENLAKAECVSVGGIVLSTFCHEAITYLEQHIEEEGLFRKSGSAKRQHIVKQEIKQGKALKDVFRDISHDDVAALVKQYLRNLAEPLLTRRLQHHFLRVCLLSSNTQCRILQLLVFLLPVNHAGTLYHLLQFLLKVSGKSAVNKMSLTNLALVIAPNLFSFDLNEVREVTHHQPDLIKSLLQFFPEIFCVPSVMQITTPKKGLISKVKQLSEKLTPKRKRKASPASPGLLRKVRKADSNLLMSPKPQTPIFHNNVDVQFAKENVCFSATPAHSVTTAKIKGGSSCSKIGRWIKRRQVLRSAMCTSAQANESDIYYGETSLFTPIKSRHTVDNDGWKTPVTRMERHAPILENELQSTTIRCSQADSDDSNKENSQKHVADNVHAQTKCVSSNSVILSEQKESKASMESLCKVSGVLQQSSHNMKEPICTEDLHQASDSDGKIEDVTATTSKMHLVCVRKAASSKANGASAINQQSILIPDTTRTPLSSIENFGRVQQHSNLERTRPSNCAKSVLDLSHSSKLVAPSVKAVHSVSSPRLSRSTTVDVIKSSHLVSRSESVAAAAPSPQARSLEDLEKELHYHEERINRLRAVILRKQNNNVHATSGSSHPTTSAAKVDSAAIQCEACDSHTFNNNTSTDNVQKVEQVVRSELPGLKNDSGLCNVSLPVLNGDANHRSSSIRDCRFTATVARDAHHHSSACLNVARPSQEPDAVALSNKVTRALSISNYDNAVKKS